MDLANRVAVVTGASSGIGRATAKALAAEGMRVALVARRSANLETLAHEIERDGGRSITLPTDVRDKRQILSMLETTLMTFGRVDILVNSAGVIHWKALADADPDEWHHEMEVNLLALMDVTHAAVTLMLEHGGGHIVNVSSLIGRYPGPGGPGYTTSKWGVSGFTESIRRDPTLRQGRIQVTLIEPGEVDTPMQPDEDRESMHMLDPEDVADAIVYAVSRPEHVCVWGIQLLSTGFD